MSSSSSSVDCEGSSGYSNHTRTKSASSNFLSEHCELLHGGVDGDDLEHCGAGRCEGGGLSDAGEGDSVVLLPVAEDFDENGSRADRTFLLEQQGSFTNVSRAAPLGPAGERSQLNQGEWWKRTEGEYSTDGAQVCLLPMICFIDKTPCDTLTDTSNVRLSHPPRVTLALVVLVRRPTAYY